MSHIPRPTSHQITAMFDSIAPRYDLLNRLLSLGIDTRWRRKLVKAAMLKNPRSILDLACGTADLTIALAKASPKTLITGADPSQNMLAVAHRKINKPHLQHIALIQTAAEQLPFPDYSFHAVTCAFGVRNFTNLQQGLSEMFRVLSHEGQIYILEFSTPNNSIFSKIFKLYFNRILPTIGRLISRDKKAYSYLPNSVNQFPYGENFLSLLRQAGFTNCRAKTLTCVVATLYTASKQ